MKFPLKIKYDSFLYEHEFIKKDLIDEIKKILGYTFQQQQIYLKKFEKLFAKYCKTRYAIGTNSGTTALQLSLLALEVETGDEVILPPNNYIATALAVSNIGAKPVFVDIDERTYNINADKIEAAITDKTKAIVPIHSYGQMADMKSIMKIAKEYKLKVIEDAAQAHGATYEGKKVGSIGTVGCFSFYHSKNLGGYGNGGIVITDKKNIAKNIRILRDPESNNPFLLNSKRTPAYLDTIQIAFLKTKLKYLDSWIKKRREIAKKYKKSINSKNIILPEENCKTVHTFRDFPILYKKRDILKYFLLMRGIETRIHFSYPIHLTATYKYLGHKKGSFPITEKICKSILSLPIYPFLKEQEIDCIVKNINKF